MVSGIAATGFPIIGEEDSEIGDDGQPATPIWCFWDTPFTLLCRIAAPEGAEILVAEEILAAPVRTGWTVAEILEREA